MKRLNQLIFLACGLSLMLAASPVLAQTVSEFRPNKKPLEDFVHSIEAKINGKEIDPTKPFSVKVEGVLNEDGKLDPRKSRFNKGEGDAAMINVAKNFIEAINESGLLYYLKSLGLDNIELTLAQDEKQIYSVISSSQKSEERAKILTSAMNGLVGLARVTVKETELKTLLESATVASQGKSFVINFNIGKLIAHEMIKRKFEADDLKRKAAL